MAGGMGFRPSVGPRRRDGLLMRLKRVLVRLTPALSLQPTPNRLIGPRHQPAPQIAGLGRERHSGGGAKEFHHQLLSDVLVVHHRRLGSKASQSSE
jgi:hypothetical protein